jgi:ATP-binding cassette subfamily B protein
VCALLVTALPNLYIQFKFSHLFFGFINWRTPEGRKQGYYNQLMTNNQDVKEVKLFNIGKYLMDAYLAIFRRVHQERRRLAGKRQQANLVFNLLSKAGFYGVYGSIIYRTIQRAVTIGDMTMYAQAFTRSQEYLESILRSTSRLYEMNLFLSSFFEFMDLQSQVTSPANPQPFPAPIEKGLEFRNVSFKYPGSEKWALKNVSLTLQPGEAIAIVGKNGAGKTTLVKLLTRLYDPLEGEILLDGVNIREFDLTTYRQQIGVLFQDYTHYLLSAKENIGFGKVEEVDNMSRIVASAQKSGAHEFIEKLPNRYDNTLGKWFEQGEELSIGQWQKVALARAFMRDAPLLVLDEPTASLDPEAEYEVFRQFIELTRGKMTILISHRFSTVRLADRIIVFDEGEIIEQGSHQKLMAQNGLYARLFNMQAEGYR